MTAAWVTIGALALATAAIRAGGPVAVGGRELPPRLMGVVALLAPALLAALVVTQTFGTPGGITIDERLAGVAAAGAVIAAGRSALVAVVAGAAVAALLRAVT
jgi:branched-subunit amino acid transport protein